MFMNKEAVLGELYTMALLTLQSTTPPTNGMRLAGQRFFPCPTSRVSLSGGALKFSPGPNVPVLRLLRVDSLVHLRHLCMVLYHIVLSVDFSGGTVLRKKKGQVL